MTSPAAPAMLSHAAEQAIGGAFAFLAVGVTVAAAGIRELLSARSG